MSPLIALVILGSVATSASAAAVDEVLSPLSHQQQSTKPSAKQWAITTPSRTRAGISAAALPASVIGQELRMGDSHAAQLRAPPNRSSKSEKDVAARRAQVHR